MTLSASRISFIVLVPIELKAAATNAIAAARGEIVWPLGMFVLKSVVNAAAPPPIVGPLRVPPGKFVHCFTMVKVSFVSTVGLAPLATEVAINVFAAATTLDVSARLEQSGNNIAAVINKDSNRTFRDVLLGIKVFMI